MAESIIVVPEKYELNFNWDLNTNSFEAKADIKIKVEQPTQFIELKAKDLFFKDAHFTGVDMLQQKAEVIINEGTETAALKFPYELNVGDGQLRLAYGGRVNYFNGGIFFGRFKNDSSHSKVIAADLKNGGYYQVFPTLRSVGPVYCNVTMNAPRGYTALSNMPRVSDDGDVSFKTAIFSKPEELRMVLGPFKTLKEEGCNDVKPLIKIHSCSENIHLGDCALKLAVDFRNKMQKYFSEKIPNLEKIDLVALPDYYKEYSSQYGLAFFRESSLLVSEDSTLENQLKVLKSVSSVMCQQLIFAMYPEKKTWLIDGISKFFSYLVLDVLRPGFECLKQFYAEVTSKALTSNSLSSKEAPLNKQDDMIQDKTASLIAMLYNSPYMQNRVAGVDNESECNVLEEFMDHLKTGEWCPPLSLFVHPDCEESFESWTNHSSFPLVKVEREFVDGDMNLIIKQEPYLGNEGQTWRFPINISVESKQEDIRETVSSITFETSIENVDEKQWIFINSTGFGCFRTLYSRSILEALLRGVREKTLPAHNRSVLQNDLFSLTFDSKISLIDLMSALPAFIEEDDHHVLYDLINNYENMGYLLQAKNLFEDWKLFASSLFRKSFQTVGFERQNGEKTITTLLRDKLLCMLGRYGEDSVLKEARVLFKSFLNYRNFIDPNIRYAVYTTVLCHDEEAFGMLKEVYENLLWDEERMRIERAFGSARKEKNLKKVLELSVSNEVKKEAVVNLVEGITHTVKGRELAWKFFKENWSIYNIYYRNSPIEAKLIELLTCRFASVTKQEEIQTFFEAHQPSCEPQVLKRCIYRIMKNFNWEENDPSKIKQLVLTY
ncbi:puromycin-sensitive aminopeptidase-like isoform X1 [Octopus sinensis]|uniref:Puromycin-sensitive aminopeptidase-like isoform X1 n=1 Tax=Octopus sinensis TaxID=2607531 RepID=A0A7E6FLQ9_9MOLL|nr:puromycin-sensitive aminopeptidase-like isoform X1 [Octopus sinensis]